MIKIPLNNYHTHFYIDDEDFDRVSKYKWSAVFRNGKIHSIKSTSLINGHTVMIGRFILNEFKDNGLDVDHKNRDVSDNRRLNLRFATPSQSCANRPRQKRNLSSKYKGVSWHKDRKKYRAIIGFNGKIIHIGQYNDELLAAIAYDDAALELFGEFACLNFPLYGA